MLKNLNKQSKVSEKNQELSKISKTTKSNQKLEFTKDWPFFLLNFSFNLCQFTKNINEEYPKIFLNCLH